MLSHDIFNYLLNFLNNETITSLSMASKAYNLRISNFEVSSILALKSLIFRQSSEISEFKKAVRFLNLQTLNKVVEKLRNNNIIPVLVKFCNFCEVGYVLRKLGSLSYKTSIPDNFLQGCQSLSHIEVCDSGIANIGCYVFNTCPNLKSVKIENLPKLVKIWGEVFSECSKLEYVKITNLPRLRNIGHNCFSGHALKKLIILNCSLIPWILQKYGRT